jgi:hypothetical protein
MRCDSREVARISHVRAPPISTVQPISQRQFGMMTAIA